MATYVHQTKRCPHCGKVYSQRTVKGPYARENLIVFGPLFRECPACGASFRDDDAYELAVMDPPKSYLTHFHLSTVLLSALLGAMALFFLVMSLIEGSNPIAGTLFMLALGGGLLLSDYRRYIQHVQEVQMAKGLSAARLRRDPGYALQLKLAGFNVPDEYLAAQGAAAE